MSRRFDRNELAFFAVPRTWREIEARFGSEAKTEPFRDCIILADDEGGSGDLHYLRDSRSWLLTDTGKVRVGERLIARELKEHPDKRTIDPPPDLEIGRENPFTEFLATPGPLEVEDEGEPLTAADIVKATEKLTDLENQMFVPVHPASVLADLVRERTEEPPTAELDRLIAEQAEDDDGAAPRPGIQGNDRPRDCEHARGADHAEAPSSDRVPAEGA